MPSALPARHLIAVCAAVGVLSLFLAGCWLFDDDPKRIGGAEPITTEEFGPEVATLADLRDALVGLRGVLGVDVIEESGHRVVEVRLGYADPQSPALDGTLRIPKQFRWQVEGDTVAVLYKVFSAPIDPPVRAVRVRALAGWHDQRLGVRVPITLIDVSGTRDEYESFEWEGLQTTEILYRFHVMHYNRSVLVAGQPPVVLR